MMFSGKLIIIPQEIYWKKITFSLLKQKQCWAVTLSAWSKHPKFKSVYTSRGLERFCRRTKMKSLWTCVAKLHFGLLFLVTVTRPNNRKTRVAKENKVVMAFITMHSIVCGWRVSFQILIHSCRLRHGIEIRNAQIIPTFFFQNI